MLAVSRLTEEESTNVIGTLPKKDDGDDDAPE
jgi:hypothetical protein